jgi:hypothetical protein
MGTGRVLRCSSGPEPFPGIPIKEPLQPQEPGEVLIRYELEAVSAAQTWVLCAHVSAGLSVLSRKSMQGAYACQHSA